MNDIINKYDHNFYLSNEEPCSYISNKKEKKIFTIMDDPKNSNQYEYLINMVLEEVIISCIIKSVISVIYVSL